MPCERKSSVGVLVILFIMVSSRPLITPNVVSMFARCVSCCRKSWSDVTWFARTAFVCPAKRSILSWLAPFIAPLNVLGSSSSNCSNRSLYISIAAAKFAPAACMACLKRACSVSVNPLKEPFPSSSNPISF